MKELLNPVQDLTENLSNVEALYGEQDLSSSTLFAGGFINFGFWENIDLRGRITKKSRILSSQKLYEKVFEALSIRTGDAVMEVGCGLGNGAILLHKKFSPKFIVGIDASAHQIQRALKKHCKYLQGHKDSIRFMVCPAEAIEVKAHRFDKIFSIEALQHFNDLRGFLHSVFLALKPNGKLIISTFFFRVPPPSGFMDLFPNFQHGIDKIVQITEFTDLLRKQGFQKIRHQSIGKSVWKGFDKWISQTEYKDTWDKNWKLAYDEGILDYFFIEAVRP
jgi:ubiquinone/menaquinone biosynthesis C-methylase UbiE